MTKHLLLRSHHIHLHQLVSAPPPDITHILLSLIPPRTFQFKTMTQQFPRKLIVDADTGIDDAMALVLALDAHKRGEADVRAVTCVAGNTAVENSLVNVLRILDVMGCPEARSSYNALRIFCFLKCFKSSKLPAP